MARSARTDCGRLDLGDASRLAILVLDHVHRVRTQRAGLYLHHSRDRKQVALTQCQCQVGEHF